MTNLRTSAEAKLEDLRKGCKISEELLSENNEFEKQRAILMGQHPQHKDLREPAERRYDNATTMEMTQDAKNAREAKIEVNSDNYESDESSYRLEIENCVRQIKKMGNIISGVNELINRRSAEDQLSMQINAVLPMLNCRTDVCKMLKQLLDAGYPVQSGDVDKYVRKALDSSGYTELQNKQRTTAAKLKLLTGEDFTDAARSMKQKLGRIDHHIQRLENEKAEEAPSKAEEAPSKAEEAPSKAEEARLQAEKEVRLQAEKEARLQAEKEAPSKAEEAPSKAEEAPSKAEEAPSKAEEARLQAEKEVRLQAEKEVPSKAEEARVKEEEVRLQADRQPLQVEKQQEISSESGTKSRELNKEELIEGVKKSKERITALENQLSKLRNEKSAVERTSAYQSRQIEILQAQIDPLIEEHGETEKTINKLNSDLKEQKSEKRQLAARIQTLESESSALRLKITKDEEAVRRLRGENSTLQSKITKDEEAVRRLRGENSTLQARAVRMESENSTLQVRVERAEESISILESENSTLRAKYEELRKISQEQDEYVQETKREKSAEQIKTERDEELVRRIENAKSDEKPLAVALHELLGEQAKQNQRELEAREAQNQRELEALRGQVANQQQLIHYYQHPHLYQYGPYPTYPS